MSQTQRWVAQIVLRAPAPLRSLRNAPLLGKLIHRLSYRMLPAKERVWAQVEVGPGKGLWLELNPRTGHMYVRGEAESAVQAILAELLRPSMVFYDLGANIGFFSLLASRIAGPNGRVFSFEPDPDVAARLRRNVERNGFANIAVTEAGVWSSNTELNFARSGLSDPDRGSGSFLGGDGATAGMPVRCVSLDDFIATAPPPDAIKCDVEGAEVEVLRGARELLEKHRPWILCEIHSEPNGRSVREILGGLGYVARPVDQNHILATFPGSPMGG